MSDHDAFGEPLGKRREPVVADRGFDRDFKLDQRIEETFDLFDFSAKNAFRLNHGRFGSHSRHDAKSDTLLVEVCTDVFHVESPFVEGLGLTSPTVYHVFKDRLKRGAASLLSTHVFTLRISHRRNEFEI